jgi:hypothetical protein
MLGDAMYLISEPVYNPLVPATPSLATEPGSVAKEITVLSGGVIEANP